MNGTLTLKPDAIAEPEAPAGRVVLASAPKLRAVYWCRFWADSLRPEFYKMRPIVVVSRNNRMDGPIIVLPLTTKAQPGNKWAVKLSRNPDVRYPTVESWAVCNHIYTVSCARLTQMGGGAPRIEPADFNAIVRKMLTALPTELPPGADGGDEKK